MFVVLPHPGAPKIRYSAVTLWSRCPISSSVPVACSSDGITGVLLPLTRRVFSGIELIQRQHPPALFFELLAANANALSAQCAEHRGDRLDRKHLEHGFVDIHLDVAGTDGHLAVQHYWFPLALDLLAFDGVDETGLREVLRNVHARRAFPLVLLAALFNDAGPQHRLRQLVPLLAFELPDDLARRSGDLLPNANLRHELSDRDKLGFPLFQLHVICRFLAGELHEPTDPDAQPRRDSFAQ